MITPITPVVIPSYPTSTVQPFTYKDGLSYLDRLEMLKRYINRVVIPYVNESYNEISNETQTAVNALIEAFNAAVEAIINSSIEIQDPLVANLVSTPSSATAIALHAIFSEKSVTDSLSSAVSILESSTAQISDELTKRVAFRIYNNGYPPRVDGVLNMWVNGPHPGLLAAPTDIWVNPDTATMSMVIAAMVDTSSDLHKVTVDAVVKEVNIPLAPESAGGMVAFGSSPDIIYAWPIAKGGTNSLRFVQSVPESWSRVDMILGWLAREEGAARLNIAFRVINNSGVVLSDSTTTSYQTSVGPMRENIMEYKNRAVVGGGVISGTITRISDNAGDTIAGTVGALRLRMRRVF